MKIIFWVFVFLVAYHYVLYPSLVILLARFREKQSFSTETPEQSLPSVSLIVAAYNEEKVIEAKIENCLALDYPKDKLQIIIACDGSDDRTEELVLRYEDQGVVCLYQPERKGKSNALNRAVAISVGDLLLFSDANNEFNKSAVRALVNHFDDQRVGGVCGVKCIKPDDTRDSSVGDGLYWQYESAIKLAESDLNSITCADGEIFALRKSLYQPIEKSIINDDLELTLSLVKRGYVIKYEPEAKSHELASISALDDFWVKVRMVAGGYQALANHFAQLSNLGDIYNLMFWSHKVIRWFAPVLLLAIFLINLVLVTHASFYLLTMLMQILFYSLAVYGGFSKQKPLLPSFIYVPFYFSFMNIAAFWGLVRFLSGSQNVAWKKASR